MTLQETGAVTVVRFTAVLLEIRHGADTTDDTQSGPPGSLSSKGWTDGQMFPLVRVEKTDSVYTIQIRQWAKPALWGKSKHSFPRGHPVEKKAAVHKWVKPGVKLLWGELKLLFVAAVTVRTE